MRYSSRGQLKNSLQRPIPPVGLRKAPTCTFFFKFTTWMIWHQIEYMNLLNVLTSQFSIAVFQYSMKFLPSFFKPVVCVYVCACACMHACVPVEARRRHLIFWRWIFRELWATQCWYLKMNSGPLEEQQVFLMNKPSFQSPFPTSWNCQLRHKYKA